MAKIVWNSIGQRFYETGLDQGVLYVDDLAGIPWNGLVNLDETPTGGTPTPYYLDGKKILNIASQEEFEGSIQAFGHPELFNLCKGHVQIGSGLFVTQQKKKTFGLAYRTKIGNDLDLDEHGYKLHLLYDLLASENEVTNSSVNSGVSPVIKSWNLVNKPKQFNSKKISHLVLDSTSIDTGLLSVYEGLLYGSVGIEPRLPSPAEMLSIFEMWNDLEDILYDLNFKGQLDSDITEIVNLLPYSTMDGSGTVIEVYRNIILDPLAVSNSSTYHGSAVAGTYSTITSWSGHSTALRHTRTGSGTLRASFRTGATILASTSYYCFIRVQLSAATNLRFALRQSDASGTNAVEYVTGSLAAGTHDLGFILTTGASFVAASDAGLVLLTGGGTIGDTIDLVDAMMVASTVTLPFFCGGITSPDSDMTSSWVGTANQTASVLTGIMPPGISRSGTSVAPIRSTQMPGYPVSLRVINVRQSGSNHARILTDVDGSGKTFTGKLFRYSPVTVNPQSSTVLRQGSGSLTPYVTIINTGSFSGIQEKTGNGTAPISADSEIVYFQLPGPTTMGLSIWYAIPMLIEGLYSGPLFNGDTAPFIYNYQEMIPEWIGTPDASASKIYWVDSFAGPGISGDAWIFNGDLWIYQSPIWENHGEFPITI